MVTSTVKESKSFGQLMAYFNQTLDAFELNKLVKSNNKPVF